MIPKIQLWFYVSGAAGFGLTVLYDVLQLQNRLKVRRVISAATAALYRHPDVAMPAASLLGMELIVVTLEDRLIFPRLFPGYREYRSRVPMLFPFRFGRRVR
jgi:protein-S-isoprenylcysteine O-methyltransferase Ste14